MAEPENKTLRCPGCPGALADVYAEANYGRVMLLDQCQGCGGVWFDKWELYFLKGKALEALHTVDEKSLFSTWEGKGAGKCPKCDDVKLELFIDPQLPKDATIMRCNSCGGLWLNRGDIEKYANGKKTTKIPAGETTFTMPVPLDTLKHLQKDLDTRTLAAREDAPAQEPPLNGREFAKDVGFLLLQSVLRLVFKV